MNNRTSASKNSSSFAYLAIQYMPSLLYLLWLLFSSTLFYCKLHRYLFFPAPFLSKQPNPLFLQPRNAEYAYLFIKLIKHFNSEMREYYFLAKYALIQIDLFSNCKPFLPTLQYYLSCMFWFSTEIGEEQKMSRKSREKSCNISFPRQILPLK